MVVTVYLVVVLPRIPKRRVTKTILLYLLQVLRYNLYPGTTCTRYNLVLSFVVFCECSLFDYRTKEKPTRRLSLYGNRHTHFVYEYTEYWDTWDQKQQRDLFNLNTVFVCKSRFFLTVFIDALY